MKDHTNSVRGFYWASQAGWHLRYGELDRFMVGMYTIGGGSTGEFGVSWTIVGGRSTPQLQAFDDSWHALAQFRDLLDAMAEVDSEDVTPERFCEMLLACGIRDLTRAAA